MSRAIRVFRLEKWWKRQPGKGARVAVLARTLAGRVKSVKLVTVGPDCIGLVGAVIGLAVYAGRDWPRFRRVRVKLI